MLYRIWTEDVGRESVKEVVGKRFDAYTLLSATGIWKGITEQSLCIEIVTEPCDNLIKEIAEEIKTANRQEAVLIQKVNTDHILV